MPQQTSPFVETKYGWNFGESNWNGGMDENLLKFGFLFDSNIDGIVASVPLPAVNGKAYFSTVDSRVYFAVNTVYYSTPLPMGFQLKNRADGKNYQFDGTSLFAVESLTEISDKIQTLESRVTDTEDFDSNLQDVSQGTRLIPYSSSESVYQRLGKTLFIQKPSDLPSITVDSTTVEIVTSYAETPNYGGTVYRKYSGTSAEDGFCIIKSSDGQKWKSVGKPSPQIFGAVDGSDITIPLQRWANYIASHNEPASWDVSGFLTSKVIAAVPENSTTYARKIEGKIRLTDSTASPTTPIECLLEFQNFIQSEWGDGEYIGRQVFSQRNVDNGFRFTGCKYMSAGTFYIWGCRRFGIDLGYYTTEFKFQAINTLYCGSNNYQRYPFSYASTFRYGTGVNQRSAIQGASSGGTPLVLDPALRPGDGFLVNNHYYHVREVDHVGGNFRVFPWLTAADESALTSDPVNNAFVVIGGGMRHGGGETNAGYIARFSGLVNGHDIQADELYPVSVSKFGTQLSAVGIRLGLDYQNAYRGGSIADAYVEACRVFVVELASGGESPYQIMQVGQYTPTIGVQHPGLTVETTWQADLVSSLAYVLTPQPMTTVSPYGQISPVLTTAAGNTPVTTVVVGAGFGQNIKLSRDPLARDAHRRFAIQINLVAATSGGSPGSITFTADTGDLVMGVSSFTKSYSTSVMLVCYWNANNWTIVQSSAFSV